MRDTEDEQPAHLAASGHGQRDPRPVGLVGVELGLQPGGQRPGGRRRDVGVALDPLAAASGGQLGERVRAGARGGQAEASEPGRRHSGRRDHAHLVVDLEGDAPGGRPLGHHLGEAAQGVLRVHLRDGVADVGQQRQAGAGAALAGQRELAGVLGVDARGDVGLHADEVDQGALAVEDRGDRHLVPERRAVGAVVEQGLADGLGRTQGGADAVDRRAVGVGPLQEPAVAPEHLARAVPGGALERGVHPHQGVVLDERVADGERQVGGHDRAVVHPRGVGHVGRRGTHLEQHQQRAVHQVGPGARLVGGTGLGRRERDAGDPQHLRRLHRVRRAVGDALQAHGLGVAVRGRAGGGRAVGDRAGVAALHHHAAARHAARHGVEVGAGAAEGGAVERGEAGAVAPLAQRHREPGVGDVGGGATGVHDVHRVEVDEQDGRDDLAADHRQPARAPALGGRCRGCRSRERLRGRCDRRRGLLQLTLRHALLLHVPRCRARGPTCGRKCSGRDHCPVPNSPRSTTRERR